MESQDPGDASLGEVVYVACGRDWDVSKTQETPERGYSLSKIFRCMTE